MTSLSGETQGKDEKRIKLNNLVSVIVATYHRDESLYYALKSLAEQTYDLFEVVLVDDNGDPAWNNKVEEIFDKIKIDYPTLKIRYIKNDINKGSAETRNIGIATAEGEYITFLDDDDVYLPNKILNQVNIMIKENADYSLTDLLLYNEDGKLCEKRKRTYLCGQSENLLLCHLKYHMTGTDTMMFKKKYLFDINGFEPINVGDEYYLMMKAIINGGKFVYLPESDVKAFVHSRDNGLSSGEGKIKGENELYTFKESFFSQIRKKDIRYIKMRHHAVKAYTYLRMKKYIGFMLEAIHSFFYNPIACVGLLVSRRK